MTDYQDKISEFLGYAHRVGAAGLRYAPAAICRGA